MRIFYNRKTQTYQATQARKEGNKWVHDLLHESSSLDELLQKLDLLDDSPIPGLTKFEEGSLSEEEIDSVFDLLLEPEPS